MSSSKPKKVVHYSVERGSSKPSHRYHNSRDSGVGSSSASDRATVHDEEAFPERQVEDQRYNLRVVQEALDAAYDRIKALEASNTSLNHSLTESNKENRALKKEKNGLIKENEDLLDVIEELNAKIKKQRENSPRSAGVKVERRPSISVRPAPPSPRHHDEFERPLVSSIDKRSSIRQGPPSPRQQVHIDERPLSNHSDRRSSLYDRTALPTAPQPPPNHHPNPFAPRTTPTVTYASMTPTVTYAPSTVSYTSQPVYAVSSHSSHSSKRSSKDDGKYHLQPL